MTLIYCNFLMRVTGFIWRIIGSSCLNEPLLEIFEFILFVNLKAHICFTTKSWLQCIDEVKQINLLLPLLLSVFMILFQITMQLSVVFLVVLAASWVQAAAVANRCDPTIIAFIKAYNEKVPEYILLTVSKHFLKLIFVVSRKDFMKL